MEAPFPGFEESKKGFTSIPDQFFSELLPAIQDMNELKLVIYMLWSANKQGDYGVAFTLQDLLADQKLIGGLAGQGRDQKDPLEAAIKLALHDNILIRIENPQGESFFFINSPRGRIAAHLAEQGKETGAPPAGGVTLDIVQPNVFQLYADNIGPLTPLIADALRDAEDTYPTDWIKEAIEIAVENNVRRWKYVEAILARWQEEGRNGTHPRNDQEDYRRYLKGEFGQFGEH